ARPPEPRPRRDEPEPALYARLPRAPKTASPVPHLTSLYHFHRAGEYGDRTWPGNCGGNLIKHLLAYFKPGLVFDPMSGSGTCNDVCKEMGIACMAWDIHEGFDACNPKEDHRASQLEESLMDLGRFILANSQPPEVVQPRQRPLHVPAIRSQPAPMRRPPSRDVRTDAAPAQLPAMRVRVVASVAIQAGRPATWAPRLAA